MATLLFFTQVQTEQRIQQVLDPRGTGHLQKDNSPGGIILLARLPLPSASLQTLLRGFRKSSRTHCKAPTAVALESGEEQEDFRYQIPMARESPAGGSSLKPAGRTRMPAKIASAAAHWVDRSVARPS